MNLSSNLRPVVAMDAAITAMAVRATAEGFAFMQTLLVQWDDGSNRFDNPGETYLGLWHGDSLVAAGGLNCDPYCSDPAVGRVRHLYVCPSARRTGAGSELMSTIVGAARESFSLLRLRTTTARGAAFYEALGFERCDAADASHVLRL